jgi:hypothetical protein
VGVFVGSFHALAALEDGAGADEGDQERRVDARPRFWGLEEHERHRRPGRS